MGGRGTKFAPGRSGTSSGGADISLGPNVPRDVREALGEKGKAFSVADSTVEANPYYSNKYAAYSENCQRCVVAYEMRRRGYDVDALPTYNGDNLPRIAYVDRKNNIYHGRWTAAFREAKVESVGAAGNNARAENRVIQNIADKMRSYGDGARAVVQIFYRGGGGHVFNVENNGGRIVYAEAQAGYMKDIAATMKHVKTESVNLVRTDNLRISDRIKRFVHQKGAH